MRTHYEVLGIGPWATYEELRLAYLNRAHELHPDLHFGAPPMVLDRLNDEMAAVNEAWRVLGDEQLRREYDVRHMGVVRRQPPSFFAPGGPGWRTAIWVPPASGAPGGYGPAATPPMPRPGFNAGVPPGVAPPVFDPDSPTGLHGGATVTADRQPKLTGAVGWSGVAPAPAPLAEPSSKRRARGGEAARCRFCGSTPATTVTLRGSRPGLFDSVYAPGRAVHGPVCRSCGLAVFRDLTDFALVGGGGGPGYLGAALLLSWLTAVGNLAFWPRIRLLRAPQREDGVRAPLPGSLEPGASVLRRHGMRLVYVVVLAVALLVVTSVVLAHE